MIGEIATHETLNQDPYSPDEGYTGSLRHYPVAKNTPNGAHELGTSTSTRHESCQQTCSHLGVSTVNSKRCVALAH